MMRRFALFFTLLLWIIPFGYAQTEQLGSEKPSFGGFVEQDSLQISLLTCSPGPEVYALYGHTALRVVNHNNGSDLVFNYGSFNMAEPNFILKFMLGLLDYELGLVPFERFWMHYSNDGCDITQQELNLTPEEKARFYQVLAVNYLPENRGYRYNFLYDNCSTRPRDIIASVIDGELQWNDQDSDLTYRKLMHQCNDPWPWSRLGVDLVLGQAADKKISPREQEFLPVYLLDHLNEAVIRNAQGQVRPMVANTTVLKAVRPLDDSKEFFLTPLQCVTVLLVFVLILAYVEIKKHKLYWGVDVLFHLAQGIAGVLIFILFFFSEHPTVNTNWLLWIFNPIPLLYLPVMIYCRVKSMKEPYHVFNAVWLFLFVLASMVIPQDLPIESIYAASVLMIRSMSHVRHDYLSKTVMQ